MRMKFLTGSLAGVLLLMKGFAAEGANSRLADAAEAKDEALVRSLLRQGVAANEPQADGTTALHWAIYWNQSEVAERLLEAGADANAVNRYGITPLSLACSNGEPAMVAMLLAGGATPDAATPYGETPLMTAARTGNPDVVSILVAAGANVNLKEAQRGQTALMWAAAEKNAAAARVLLKAGADVSVKSNTGMTALLFAARSGDVETVRTLVQGGANVNETADDALAPTPRPRPQAKSDESPAVPAVAPTSSPLGSSVLVTAIRNTHYELAAWLVGNGANPNVDGPRGTALHQLLRSRNCERTARPCPAETSPLDSLGLARILLAHGADVNARLTQRPPAEGTYDGNYMSLVGATPFFLAVKASDTAMMRLLLEHGANPTIGNEDDTTPLMVAAGVGFIEGQVLASEAKALEAVEMLVGLGHDVNAANKVGETALHGAAYRGANSIVKYLVARGAKLDAADDKGLLPVTVADGFRRRGGFLAHDDTAALLRGMMGPNAPPRKTDQGAR